MEDTKMQITKKAVPRTDDPNFKKEQKIAAVGKLLDSEEETDKLEVKASQFHKAIQLFAATLDETTAMEIATVYPDYEVGKAYKAGDYFTNGGNSVGDPQLYVVLQDHTSAAEWTPDTATSLYKAVGITSAGHPVWSQPVGASDAYAKGDIVDYNGTLYRSTIDANVWSPDAYPAGWEVYTA
jgi:hypothetical protein